ncbi:unnamed protein product [Diatraea saccharalis]|uniref:Reverse transcriptase n=1 Tax=Diatraea saccharalis TaxID=40085 RepID=A0A9N9N0J6_9NEOP|nr:unnamed protein product [Diatraea saccharalis]
MRERFNLINIFPVPEFLQPNDYLCKIDLCQAYCHLKISRSHRNWCRTYSSLQSKRNVSNLTRIKRSLSVPASFHSSDSVRQQNCYCLPQESGRYKVKSLDELDIASVSDLRPGR